MGGFLADLARELLRGHEQNLARAGGVFVPAGMILVYFTAPVVGAETAYALLKVAAAAFVLIAVLWYLADDTVIHDDEIEDETEDEAEGPSDDIEEKAPGGYFPPVRVQADTVFGKGERPEAPDNFVGRRSSDKLRAFPGLIDDEEKEEPAPRTYTYRGKTGGGEGPRDQGVPRESQIPPDAKLIREEDGWAIYFSASENACLIRTTDYHPRPLRLTEDKLRELLKFSPRG